MKTQFNPGDRVAWSTSWLAKIGGGTIDLELEAMRGTVVANLLGPPFTRVRVQWDGESEPKSSREECLRLKDNV